LEDSGLLSRYTNELMPLFRRFKINFIHRRRIIDRILDFLRNDEIEHSSDDPSGKDCK